MRVCLWLLFCGVCLSCSKEPVYIETVNVSENPYLISIDTFSTNATVFRLDSFLTSGQGFVVSGYHADTAIGNTYAASYFQFGLPSGGYENIGQSSEFFDSMVFVARINPSFYGDSNAVFKVNIHALAEEIYHEDDQYYNTASFREETVSLGSFSGKLRPATGDSVRIKMDDAFGRQLFQYYKENNETVQNTEAFQRWLRGIKLVPDSTVTDAIYAFSTGDTSVYMRMYYHEDVAVRVKKELDFVLSGAGKDFSEVRTDCSGTGFSVLTPGASVSSTVLGNRFLDFPLAGIRTGFSFPGIASIPGYGDFVQLMGARFSIYPEAGTYSSYYLPDPFYMYFRLPDLSYEGPLATLAGDAAQTGNLQTDALYGIDTYHIWDVTGYISTEMSANYYTARTLVPLSGNGSVGLGAGWYSRFLGRNEPGKIELAAQLLIHQSND